MPMFFGQEAKKRELIDNLPAIFEDIRVRHKVSPGDFPEIEKVKVSKINLNRENMYH